MNGVINYAVAIAALAATLFGHKLLALSYLLIAHSLFVAAVFYAVTWLHFCLRYTVIVKIFLVEWP